MGVVRTTLAALLVVRLVIADGSGVPGVELDFAVTSGGGSVSPARVRADAAGHAAAAWAMGPTAGSASGVAKSASPSVKVDPVRFRATANLPAGGGSGGSDGGSGGSDPGTDPGSDGGLDGGSGDGGSDSGSGGAGSGLAAAVTGIWISRSEVRQRPTTGAAWERVLLDAGRSPGVAAIADQDSNHDVYTLASALVCARTGQYCDKARKGVVDAIGTESGGRWLAVGRNLTAYVISADLLELRADGNPRSDGSRVEVWIRSWPAKLLADNNTGALRGFAPFHSGSNAAAQEGLAYAAVAAYLADRAMLDRAWDAFRTYACDPGAPNRERIDLSKGVEYGWAHNNSSPCAVNPAGSAKVVPAGYPGAGGSYRIDGAIINDMYRGGYYQWPPQYTQYSWVGLEGFVPAAVILSRAGYSAFEVANRAVLRTHDYLWFLRRATGNTSWFDGTRAREVVHIVNVVYGKAFPVNSVTGAGRTVGYTDWTFSTW